MGVMLGGFSRCIAFAMYLKNQNDLQFGMEGVRITLGDS
jgi:hypothetical protein